MNDATLLGLKPRAFEIFNALVTAYLGSGQPIGSKTLAQRLRHGFGADTFVNAGTCDMGKSASFDVNAAKGCAYQLQSACLVRCSCACTDASPAGNGTAARTQNSLSPILCVALIFDNSHSMLRDKAVRCTLKTSPGSDTALSDTGSGSNRRTTAMF